MTYIYMSCDIFVGVFGSIVLLVQHWFEPMLVVSLIDLEC